MFFLRLSRVVSFLLCLGPLGLLPAETFYAKAELLLDTHRIVLHEKNRSASIMLMNSSASERRYRIFWSQLRQNPDGSYTRINGPKEIKNHPLVRAIRYGPRRVTLLPGASQILRFSLRGRKLPPGEQRLHLNLTTLPYENPQETSQRETSEQNSKKSDKGAQIKINFLLGISIPVIVRTGSPKASVRLSDPVFTQIGKEKRLYFTAHRTGNASFLGKATVYALRKDGQEKIGIAQNINIFTELPSRKGYVILRTNTDFAQNPPILRLVYQSSEDDEKIGDELVLSSAWIRNAAYKSATHKSAAHKIEGENTKNKEVRQER